MRPKCPPQTVVSQQCRGGHRTRLDHVRQDQQARPAAPDLQQLHHRSVETALTTRFRRERNAGHRQGVNPFAVRQRKVRLQRSRSAPDTPS